MTAVHRFPLPRAWCLAICRALLLALLAAPASTARADVPRSQRDAAVALGEDGLRLIDQRQYAQALERFEEANKLVPAPTFGVRAALCLERLGRLVEALERYERVASMEVDPSWPEVHANAQAEARRRAADLRKRVARVYVQLRGPNPERATVDLDGRPLTYQDLASAVLLDPGDHTIQVEHAGTTARRRFRVKEGAQHQETFTLGTPDDTQQPAGSAQRTLGWVGVGVGAAALTVGTVTGLVAWGRKNDLETRCPDRVCPPEAWDDNDAYYRWRNASTMGFAVGTVVLGAGTLLLLTDEAPPREPATARVQPWVGWGAAGLQGGF